MITFFIRGYNDTDHIVPVIWRMHGEGHTVSVSCLAPDIDLDRDYRIQFLRKTGISVKYLYDDELLLPRSYQRALWIFVRTIFGYVHYLNSQDHAHYRAFIRRILFRLAYKAFRYLNLISFDPNTLDRYLKDRKVDVLCFDWVPPEKFIVHSLLEAASRLSIPTIALPHGVFLCTNDDITWSGDPGRSIGWRNALDDPFNEVVIQYSFYERYLHRNEHKTSKAIVLGSARYCEEWVDKNIEIAPRSLPISAYKDPRLKCVFMNTRLQYKINKERMRSTFECLSRFDGAKVVLKPHTRASELALYSDLTIDEVSHISSVELCQWADVILVVASSVMIEALQQNKVVLYLKYLHSNRTLHEEYKDCWVIESEEELSNALYRLKHNLRDIPYLEEDVDRFLVDVVCGGIPHRDVLGDYSKHIAELANKE